MWFNLYIMKSKSLTMFLVSAIYLCAEEPVDLAVNHREIHGLFRAEVGSRDQEHGEALRFHDVQIKPHSTLSVAP